MRGTNTRVAMIVAALILAIAASAAVAIRHIGNGGSADSLAKPASRPAGEAATQPGDQAAESFDQYTVVADRDIFKPLVAAPTPKLDVPDVPSPSRTGRTSSTRPPAPPSPTADLAMTGVVERSGRVQALIQNVKTAEAQYVAEGSSAFGLHVVRIDAKAVVFSKDGKEYTLRMGEKAVPTQSGEAEHRTFAASGEASPSTGATTGPGGGTPRFGFGRRGGSGGDLSDMQRRLDEARSSGRMSEEQYQRAQRYMDMRRGGGGGGRRGG